MASKEWESLPFLIVRVLWHTKQCKKYQHWDNIEPVTQATFQLQEPNYFDSLCPHIAYPEHSWKQPNPTSPQLCNGGGGRCLYSRLLESSVLLLLLPKIPTSKQPPSQELKNLKRNAISSLYLGDMTASLLLVWSRRAGKQAVKFQRNPSEECGTIHLSGVKHAAASTSGSQMSMVLHSHHPAPSEHRLLQFYWGTQGWECCTSPKQPRTSALYRQQALLKPLQGEGINKPWVTQILTTKSFYGQSA